jgi:hypothetical protein
MSRSVASGERVIEEPNVSGDYLPLLGVVPPQVIEGKCLTEVDLCALLAEAIDATGQRKEAALAMGISGPVLSKQLMRVENASPNLARMSVLKRETLLDFGQRILTACGAGDPRVQRQQIAEEAVRAIGKLIAIAVAGADR